MKFPKVHRKSRHCSMCHRVGHDRRAHIRGNPDFFRDDNGVVHPIRGTAGYEDNAAKVTLKKAAPKEAPRKEWTRVSPKNLRDAGFLYKSGRYPIGASQDAIANFLQDIDDINKKHGARLDPRKLWGKSESEIEAEAQRQAKAWRKGKGKRALVKKLGKEGAEDYIYRKSGRHYSLNV